MQGSRNTDSHEILIGVWQIIFDKSLVRRLSNEQTGFFRGRKNSFVNGYKLRDSSQEQLCAEVVLVKWRSIY